MAYNETNSERTTMLTAKELYSILVHNQERRYRRHIANGGTPETFYASNLETVATRLIDEARVAYNATLVTSL